MPPAPKTYEMLWDCRFCGTAGLLGLTHRFCPSCGAPQDPTVRYFPDEAQKVAVEDHVYAGADRGCPACETPNSARSEFCGSCGAPLTDAAAVARQQDQRRDAGPEPAGGGGGWQPVGDDAAAGVSGQTAEREAKRRSWVPWGVGGLLLAVVVLVVMMLTWTRSTLVEVTEHSWQRTIAVERYGEVEQSGWCDSLPADARVINRFQAQRGTRQVPDGQDCSVRRQDQGDGTYTETTECRPRYRAEPVMDQRCRYLVLRWSRVREARASGNGLEPAPRWPEPSLARQGQCDGCERLGARGERYQVALRELKSGKSHQCRVPEPRWRALRPGARGRIEIGAITGAANCGSLETTATTRTAR